ncbi:MAG: pirin family protein [Proteobacteria bacterium]|nr:MAG: pirin family protein [Pseudomonadota bacterium]
MITKLYPANKRGTADHGWLQANFSFSFGSYFDEQNLQFGMLRVLNDDTISAGTGFGMHRHDNMEIVTIPLEGGLKHVDSMGNEGVIGFGEVQVMSAGTGILHSEMNASQSHPAKTLQLWVFPDRQGVSPRYGQKSFDIENNRNVLVNIVCPYDQQKDDALWVYQQTWFSIGALDAGKSVTYVNHRAGNGAYIFLLDGRVDIAGTELTKRDALGITDFESFIVQCREDSKLLIVEVPMTN